MTLAEINTPEISKVESRITKAIDKNLWPFFVYRGLVALLGAGLMFTKSNLNKETSYF
jgi:hypothetical protein